MDRPGRPDREGWRLLSDSQGEAWSCRIAPLQQAIHRRKATPPPKLPLVRPHNARPSGCWWYLTAHHRPVAHLVLPQARRSKVRPSGRYSGREQRQRAYREEEGDSVDRPTRYLAAC